MSFLDYLLIATGFVFTFFIPGFVVVETFFRNLSKLEKLPLYLAASSLISTWSVYLLALVFGYSKYSIILCFSVFAFWLWILFWQRRLTWSFPKKHFLEVAFSLAVFFIFAVSLYPAIFFKYKNYYVMSADNWQDTAMHMSIIQSISQGNFPPQAPYYSGVPLDYYYFSDFHTAIISTLVARFVPRLLILDNSLFALIYSLSLYTFIYYLWESRKIAAISSILAVFSGNLMFIRFIADLVRTGRGNIINLLASSAYTMEYTKLMQVTPIVDYFLQNRPMMVGLPVTVLVAHFIWSGYKRKEVKRLLLAGFLAGMLVKFQLFAFGASAVIFVISTVIWSKRVTFKKILYYLSCFLIPAGCFFMLTLLKSSSGHSALEMIRSGFSFGPWDRSKDSFWFVKFHLANYGLPFVFVLLFLSALLLGKIKVSKVNIFLSLWFTIMFILPHLVRFTILDRDMFKFFYFMTIPMSIVSGFILVKILKRKAGPPLVLLIIVVSSLTSVLTLVASFLNRNYAYSAEDFNAGIWIRENTPKSSVFIELPRVHSPASDIGGRLRTLSYISWPYSHGYNQGEDNVFHRLGDIESLYKYSDNTEVINILTKYKVNYVYYGRDEKGQYPEAEKKLSASCFLKLVYDLESTKIYQFKN